MNNPATLKELREQLDTVDHIILEAAARRAHIVRDIADRKANAPPAPRAPDTAERPLFDRDRERAVYQRARLIAGQVGLSEQTAHRLMLTLVEASHEVQEELSRRRALAKATAEAKRFLIVGGNGRMGKRLGPAFTERGHSVSVIEPGDGQNPATAAGEAA